MVIVESDYKLPNDTYLILPVFKDPRAHPSQTSLSVLYLRSMWSGVSYVLPIDHADSEYHWPLQRVNGYGPLKALSYHLEGEIHDVLSVEWTRTNHVRSPEEFYRPIMHMMYSQEFRKRRNINETIPLMQLIAYLDDYADYLIRFCDTDILFRDSKVIPVLKFLESAGVYTKSEGLVYSQYNPYTATGRIANARFGMLDRTGGKRKDLISRFPNGRLVSMDYEGFHLRLIATLLQYRLPASSVHYWLAQQYFQTAVPRKDQYEAAKDLTFQIIYGTQSSDIEFFQRIQQLREKIWEQMQRIGRYYTRCHSVELKFIDTPSASKVFNYVLQTIEMETAVEAIFSLISLYETVNSRVVLYTYDSILIDFDPSDGTELLKKTERRLTLDGKYPVRISSGENYQEMETLTI